MAWVVLILSGSLETVWAAALSASKGFRRPVPVLVFLVSLFFSMFGLGWAMRELPPGTSYAIWVGVGATLTVVWSILSGQEKASLARVLLIALLIGSIAGLQVVA